MLELTVTVDRQRGPRPLPVPGPRAVTKPVIDGELERRLRAEPIVWISSTRPDGLPHVLPIWFSWDGRAIWIFSKPGAQKVRNVGHCATVMLAVGTAHPEFDVELLEGCAEVLDQPTSALLPAAHVDKYRESMARAGLTPETYAARYSEPVRIVPSRVLDWHARELMTRNA